MLIFAQLALFLDGLVNEIYLAHVDGKEFRENVLLVYICDFLGIDYKEFWELMYYSCEDEYKQLVLAAVVATFEWKENTHEWKEKFYGWS